MGLDTSHDCWHGPYSAFMRWRCEIAKAAGFPPLQLMDGFCKVPKGVPLGVDVPSEYIGLERYLPVSWSYFFGDPLSILLHHSDCDGEIRWQDCRRIANRLSDTLPGIADQWVKGKTEQFIEGLNNAHDAEENVIFH